MRRTLLGAVVTAVLGVVALVVFAAGATMQEDRAAAFEAHGARTAGLVVSVDPGGPRRSGALEVRYTVGEVERVRWMSLDGLSPAFRAGEPITVIYDRDDPERIAAPGVPNDPFWEVMVLVILMIGGFAAVVVGVIDVIRHGTARFRHLRRRGRQVPREPHRRPDDRRRR